MADQAQDDNLRWAERWGVTGLILDLFMVGLAVVNLVWIVFDSIWAVAELRQVMGWIIPVAWLNGYSVVHEHFFRIDLCFVSVFLAEYVLRCIEAAWSRRYSAWFVYPIIHWYDLLGCIPIAGLRWLRVLRIFAVLSRLQRLGLINYTSWLPYRWGYGIYNVVMEEVSDRVVVRILGGVQEELSAAGGLQQRVVDEVILPRQEHILKALRKQVSRIGQSTYSAARADLHAFITQSVSKAVHDNREIKVIDRIPVVGGMAGGLLDHAITDIVCRVIDELAARLSSQEFTLLFEDICRSIFEALREAAPQGENPDQLMRAINDVLEVVKQQVAQRRWLDRLLTPPAPQPAGT